MQQQSRKLAKRDWRCMGSECFSLVPAPVVVVYFFLSAMQAYPITAVIILLNDDLEMKENPALISSFYGTVFIPYFFRGVFGGISDAVPIWRERRRPYIVLSMLLASAVYVMYGTSVDTLGSLYAVGMTLSIVTCIAEVCVDSVVVELSLLQLKDVSGIQSMCMSARTMGGVVGSALSIVALRYWSHRVVIMTTAAFPLLAAATALFVSDEKVQSDFGYVAHVANKCKALRATWTAVREGLVPLGAAIIFIFVYEAMPSATDTYSSFLYSAVNLKNWELSLVSFVGMFGSLVGTLVYWAAFQHRSIRVVFVGTTLLSVAFGFTKLLLVTPGTSTVLGLPAATFAMVDEFIMSFCSRMAFMPVIVLAALHSPRRNEGLAYGTLLSVLDGATDVSSFVSAALTAALDVKDPHWERLDLLIIICGLARVVPLVLLFLLPLRGDNERDSDCSHDDDGEDGRGRALCHAGDSAAARPLLVNDTLMDKN